MNYNRILFFGLLIILTASAWSEPVEIAYLDGDVRQKQGNNWDELEIGDNVKTDAVLLLEKNAIVELRYNKQVITLFTEGTYPVKSMLKDQAGLSDWGLNTILKQKIDTLFTQDHIQSVSIAVMGTRAKDFGSKYNEVDWMVEEEQDPLDQGIQYINQLKYDKAIAALEAVAPQIDQYSREDYFYYLGLAYLGNGQQGKAVNQFAKVKNNINKPYYADLVILKGKLFLEGLAYQEALRMFDLYLETMPGGAYRQSVYYMTAVCLNALGDHETALTRLQDSLAVNPGTQVAETARSWITKLSSPK